MEEGSQRALMKHLQKEQEKERRRIRDRQRRQSMTLEEREKHLARRRRNYQLRRQRAENARSNPCLTTACLAPPQFVEFPISISDVDFHVQCNGLEIPAHKSAQLPRKLRLNHVKHLARSLDEHVSLPINQKIAVDLIIKGNEIADSTCVPLKGLRLNRVKRLARSLNSGFEKLQQEDHQSKLEEQNLSFLAALNKVVRPYNFSYGNE